MTWSRSQELILIVPNEAGPPQAPHGPYHSNQAGQY